MNRLSGDLSTVINAHFVTENRCPGEQLRPAKLISHNISIHKGCDICFMCRAWIIILKMSEEQNVKEVIKHVLLCLYSKQIEHPL